MRLEDFLKRANGGCVMASTNIPLANTNGGLPGKSGDGGVSNDVDIRPIKIDIPSSYDWLWWVLGAAVLAVAVVAGNSTLIPARSVEDAKPSDGRRSDRFEVWIADQSDTRPGFGGQLLIFDGEDLMGRRPGKAAPAVRLDLGADTADLCRAETGRNPVRPHMILFNQEHTHAVLSFVASGHVVIFDAETRVPLNCFETTVSETTGTRQVET